MGVIWLAVMLKYIGRIHKERLFYNALDEIAAADPEGCLDKKRALRNIRFGLTVMTLATALTFDVRFDNTAGINLVPQFLFGLMTVFALIKLRHYISWRKIKPAFICGAVFVNLSFISYVVETFFLYYYGYDDLATKDATVATVFYTAFEAIAAVELIALAVFAVCIGGALKSLTRLNTGIEPCSDKYSLTDRDYHRALSRRINGYTVLCITLGVMKFVNTLSRGITKMVISGQQAPAYYPLIEWAGTVIALISILFIGYSLYLFGLLKEEVEMKYSGQ